MKMFPKLVALTLIAGACGVSAQAFAQSSGEYAYCVSQPGGSRLYVSDVFFVADNGLSANEWHDKTADVRVAFSDFLNSDYDDDAGYGANCHFRSSRSIAQNDRANTIAHRRQNGWSVISTGWVY